MTFNDFAIVTEKRHDYGINFWFMTESEAVNRMKVYYVKRSMWKTEKLKSNDYKKNYLLE